MASKNTNNTIETWRSYRLWCTQHDYMS